MTLIYDNPPPPKKKVCNVFIQIEGQPPKNKSLLRKHISLLISYILKCCASLKKWMMDKVPKKKTMSVTSVALYSLFQISWDLKMGPTGCPETLVRNYHSTLYNIPEERKYNVMIWR
jgi:hypothetical protein